MKYYLDLNNEEEKNTYITDVEVVELSDGTRRGSKECYSVTYANGETEDNVAYTDANAKIIGDKLLTQVQNGIDSKAKLVKKRMIGTISKMSSGVACIVGSSVVLSATAQLHSPDSTQFMVGTCVAGALALGGIILSAKGFKNKREYDSIIEEIDANQFRLEYADEAKKYLQTSPNAYLALNGKDEDAKLERAGAIFNAMAYGADPFSFLALEAENGVTDREIRRLLVRSDREKTLGLTYADGYSYQDFSKKRR